MTTDHAAWSVVLFSRIDSICNRLRFHLQRVRPIQPRRSDSPENQSRCAPPQNGNYPAADVPSLRIECTDPLSNTSRNRVSIDNLSKNQWWLCRSNIVKYRAGQVLFVRGILVPVRQECLFQNSP